MNRRKFLQSGAAAAALASLPRISFAQQLPFEPRPGAWRTFEITTRVEVLKPAGATRAWVPRALGRGDYQKVGRQQLVGQRLRAHWRATASTARRWWRRNGARAKKRPCSRSSARSPRATARSTSASRIPRSGSMRRARASTPRATELIPTDGIVRKTAHEIVKGKGGDVEKARAIYEWIVDNTFRDPKTRGCGVGDIKAMLETGNLGGKCADLNALYVGLRALGRPAGARRLRHARGQERIRLPQPGRRHRRTSRGRSTAAPRCSSPATAGCRWIPADVRKVVLEEKPQPTTLADPVVPPVRAKLFGAWEMNWLAYNEAHDVKLPGSSGAPVAFLMYPQAETGGKPPRQPRSGQLQVHDHRARDQGLGNPRAAAAVRRRRPPPRPARAWRDWWPRHRAIAREHPDPDPPGDRRRLRRRPRRLGLRLGLPGRAARPLPGCARRPHLRALRDRSRRQQPEGHQEFAEEDRRRLDAERRQALDDARTGRRAFLRRCARRSRVGGAGQHPDRKSGFKGARD